MNKNQLQKPATPAPGDRQVGVRTQSDNRLFGLMMKVRLLRLPEGQLTNGDGNVTARVIHTLGHSSLTLCETPDEEHETITTVDAFGVGPEGNEMSRLQVSASRIAIDLVAQTVERSAFPLPDGEFDEGMLSRGAILRAVCTAKALQPIEQAA